MGLYMLYEYGENPTTIVVVVFSKNDYIISRTLLLTKA